MSRETLSYKGYLGAVRYDDEEGVLRGSVVNIRDFVTFQGRSVDELRTEFRESIEDYLEFCASLGEEPNKPFSGRLTLRMKPETHRALSTLARRQGRSLNGVVSGILNKAAKKINDGLRVAPPKPAEAPKVAKKKAPPRKKAASTEADARTRRRPKVDAGKR